MAFRELRALRERRELTRYLVLIPLALICAICVVDSLFPPEVHLGPLLVAAPTFTAAFAGPLVTAAIAVLAVVAQVVIGVISGDATSRNHQVQIVALILVGTLVVLFTVVRDRIERRLATTRSVADVAQRVLLRPPPARSGPLEIASLYLAAEEEAEMGGDLYAAARTGDSTRLLIGDVRGKGLPAYGHAALLLGAFRAAAHRRAPLPALAEHLDGAIRWDTAQWGSDAPDEEEVFATATLLDLPDREPRVHTITCGHPPPLLLRDGEVRTLDARHIALPIGLGGLGGPASFRVDTFAFAPGDLLLLVTDGVTEARNAEGAFYPLADRAVAWSGCGPRDVLRLLHADLLAYVNGRLGDDAAVLAIRRADAP
ncbi:serine/threonine-protein phosphatase [Streptomyces sp. NBC_01525]|uniref:Serine/threonine-protein phosphatase n=1 Tax=Streptomyces benahoarensis TaxID=2595054 RepID=A0A553Z9A5_9ACTN|nr:PP2C family protein-serine/threonine phosphatase [Streptomyces benahoarensis]TSB17785.1 serine/threonine-protein phosphatase [Streptomyces benahoarensis]TSB38019.1 serine/threonine-protein phosphatase [Streptomyces benahoarensis]